jgi:hypothetical protein
MAWWVDYLYKNDIGLLLAPSIKVPIFTRNKAFQLDWNDLCKLYLVIHTGLLLRSSEAKATVYRRPVDGPVRTLD